MAPTADAGEAGLARVMGVSEENWTKATAGGTGLQALGLALKRDVELKLISQAAQEIMTQHAVLRSHIVETPKGKLAYTIPGASTPIVETFPWPALANTDLSGVLILRGDVESGHKLSLVLDKLVKQELNTPFPNAAHKITGDVDLVRIHVYAEPGKTVIIMKFNSGALDRPSSRVLAQGFLTSLNALVGGQVPHLPEVQGKNEVLPSLEDLVPKGKASKSFLQKGFDTVGYAMSAGKFALYPFSSGYVESKNSVFRSDILSYTLGKEGTEALMACSKKEKTNYAAALSAAFLKGVANMKEVKEKKLDKFAFTNVMDCRPYFEPPISDQAVGNYTVGISHDEQVKGDVKFWDLARTISTALEKEISKLRHFSELPVLNMLFSQVLKRPSLTPKSSLRTNLFSLFMDGPVDVQFKDVENLEMAGTFGPFASMHGIGPCFCLAEALTVDSEMTLSLVFPTPVFTIDQMEAIAKAGLAELTEALK